VTGLTLNTQGRLFHFLLGVHSSWISRCCSQSGTPPRLRNCSGLCNRGVRLSHSSFFRLLTSGFLLSEQFIPMFGLVGLEKKYNPHTTVDKMEFLVRNLSNMHFPTSIVAFITLSLLILVRQFKRNAAKRFKWIYIFPEVLVAVGLSTFFCSIWRWDLDGVPILGDVKLSENATYFAFPASKMNLMFFKRTTSTAMYANLLIPCTPTNSSIPA
jgi:hypothetical protein